MRYETLEEAAAAGAAPWTNEATEHSDYHVAVFRDAFPVAQGHLLFVPKWNNTVKSKIVGNRSVNCKLL